MPENKNHKLWRNRLAVAQAAVVLGPLAFAGCGGGAGKPEAFLGGIPATPAELEQIFLPVGIEASELMIPNTEALQDPHVPHGRIMNFYGPNINHHQDLSLRLRQVPIGPPESRQFILSPILSPPTVYSLHVDSVSLKSTEVVELEKTKGRWSVKEDYSQTDAEDQPAKLTVQAARRMAHQVLQALHKAYPAKK